MLKPKEILFVISAFRNPNAGTESQLLALVEGLDRRYFSPRLLVFSDSDYLKEYGFPCDYEILGYNSLLSPRTWRALMQRARIYRKSGIRLAHVFFIDPSIICPPVFRIFGIKTIISRRDMGYWYTWGYRFLLLLAGLFVSAVVTNSRAVKEVTRKNELIPASRFRVIQNGYLERDSGMATEDNDIFESLPDSAVIATLVANVRPIKRIPDALRAVSEVLMRCPDLHFLLVGAGDTSALTQEAMELGIVDHVHFLGQRSDVQWILKKSDIGVLCSESEGFSNSIIEYMQAGLPVICSAVGGNPEAVIDGENGFLFPVGDIGSFSGKLEKVALDRELRKELGAKAQQYARREFSVRAMLEQHQELYDELLNS